MLSRLAKNARKIDVGKLALQVAKSNAGLITDNIKEQLKIGIAGDGQAVGKYTTDRYSRRKKRLGSKAPYGIADLKLSGDLYKGLSTKIKGREVVTDSNVKYSRYQINRYGVRIYENTKQNKEEVKIKNSEDIIEGYIKLLEL